ncbi:GNAT family N-acetyltransferase [Paraburkholderia bannensis]|uniref:GNAT family N-acetyltransferase n=1 Tax=Paraburkholderia bannensis TaxID=765414 RepID=UPI002AB6E084|nr:GNAT family N-acetyltransferase [Paraburkholderia bannensis]
MSATASPQSTPQSTPQPTLHDTVTTSIARSLAQALIEDPFYRAVTIEAQADDAQRLQMLARYCELAINEANAIGEVHYAGTDGAAIWVMPQAGADAIAHHGQVRSAALKTLLGERGYANYNGICEAMAQHVPASLGDAWYLSILGVQPAARGRRLAHDLLQLTLSRADQTGATCFLETFNPLSLPFYRRLGFEAELRCVEPVTGSDYWLMARR